MKFKIIFLVIIFSTIYIESKSQCRGSITCRICTNCSRCRYCSKDGGSCGACNGVFNNESKRRQSSRNYYRSDNYEKANTSSENISSFDNTKNNGGEIINQTDTNNNDNYQDTTTLENNLQNVIENKKVSVITTPISYDTVEVKQKDSVILNKYLKSNQNEENDSGFSLGWFVFIFIGFFIVYDIVKSFRT